MKEIIAENFELRKELMKVQRQLKQVKNKLETLQGDFPSCITYEAETYFELKKKLGLKRDIDMKRRISLLIALSRKKWFLRLPRIFLLFPRQVNPFMSNTTMVWESKVARSCVPRPCLYGKKSYCS